MDANRMSPAQARSPGLLSRTSGMQGLSTSAAQSIPSLIARIEALEAALRELQACAVQQWPDGRLHVPAGHLLRIEFGATRLTMDCRTFVVEAGGRIVIHGRVSSSPPAQPLTQASGQSLQSMAAGQSPGNWQSTAQGNAINDPRRLP